MYRQRLGRYSAYHVESGITKHLGRHHVSVPRHAHLIQTKTIAGAYTLVHLVLALRLQPRPFFIKKKKNSAETSWPSLVRG